MGSRSCRAWLGLGPLAIVAATALLSAGLSGVRPHALQAIDRPWQLPPTPPFPTLAPTEPFPTLPPDVPPPSQFTPTPTKTRPATSSATPPFASPSPSPSPSATPSPTIGLALTLPVYLPYLALNDLFIEPTR